MTPSTPLRETAAGALETAESQLRRALPPLALVCGLAAVTGVTAQSMIPSGTFRPWALTGHLLLTFSGVYWHFKPPRRAHAAALGVAVYLTTMVGTFVVQSEQIAALVHLGALSVGCFYFLVDRPYLIAAQLYVGFWVGVSTLNLWPNQDFASHVVLFLIAWCGGFALHLGRIRVLGELGETRARLELESERRKRAQEEALLAQKRESLGVMAGGVAHDFNNLLVGIVGGTDLAYEAIGKPEAMRAALDMIRDSSLAAQDLCREMLDFAGGRPLSLRPVDVNEVVLEAVRLVSNNLPAGVAIEEHLAPKPCVIAGDSTQLVHAVVNLLNNAGEAMPESRGTIRVHTHATSGEECDEVVLRVEDDGAGIPPEIRGRIFDPFFTTKFAGRGLGLATVAGAVRSHVAEIDVTGTEQGTCFEIRFPMLGEGPAERERAAESKPEWSGSGNILLVDDDPVVLDVARRLLETFGVAVKPVAGGAEAIAALEASPRGYDGAIVDATMPGLDGPQTIRALRAIAPGLPVMLSSGFSQGIERERMDVHADVRFLAKPYTRHQLSAALRELLGDGEPAA